MMNLKLKLGKIKTFAQFEKLLEKKYEKTIEFTLSLDEDPIHLSLDRLEVFQKKRRQGIGTKFMTDLCAYADYNGYRVELMPVPLSSEIERNRLDGFYHKFGFKYRKKQRTTMIRCPRKPKEVILQPDSQWQDLPVY